jgi:ethanolamine utilization protein EutA
VSRSEVTLTPYSSPRRIDTDALAAFIDRAYAAAGWTRDIVDTGAVIATGEAARKDNAAAIVSLFSEQSGRFVCATAGHHLEALLAAHGSGAVALSRSADTPVVLNIDIGGGTTKLAVCRGGKVRETAALDIGARVISWDADGSILTITRAGERILRAAEVSLSIGDRPDRPTLEKVADTIAKLALRVASGERLDDGFWLTEPIHERHRFTSLVFSGGVGEYVNGNETREFGDLGKMLGAAVSRRLAGHTVLRAVESIRATCIGASQYTIQVSGDTLFLTHPEMLPLRDLAAVAIHPDRADASAIARAVRAGIERLDREDGAFAVAVRWDHGPAYTALRELCAGIRDGVRDIIAPGRPLVVVLDADVAGIIGQLLQDELSVSSPLVCVDQIQLSDLDFVDIGAVLPERSVVPVVVKSLVFSGP